MIEDTTSGGQSTELSPLDVLVQAESEQALPDGDATLARLRASMASGAVAPIAFDLAQTPAQFMGVGSKLAFGATWAWALAGVMVTVGLTLAIAQPWRDSAPAVAKPAAATQAAEEAAAEHAEAPAPPKDAPPAPGPPGKPGAGQSPPPSVSAPPQPSLAPEADPKPAHRPAPRPKAAAVNANVPSELELIREAQRALDKGRHKQLLVITQRLSDLYPKGMFVEEREAMRAMARCAGGSSKSGESFVARYPGSVSTERVQAYCKLKP